MSKRLLPIRVGHIERQSTYYLSCDKCGLNDLLGDGDLLSVVNHVNSMGWRYDGKDNCVLCPICVRALAEEEKRDEA